MSFAIIKIFLWISTKLNFYSWRPCFFWRHCYCWHYCCCWYHCCCLASLLLRACCWKYWYCWRHCGYWLLFFCQDMPWSLCCYYYCCRPCCCQVSSTPRLASSVEREVKLIQYQPTVCHVWFEMVEYKKFFSAVRSPRNRFLNSHLQLSQFKPVFRIWIRIHMFLGLPDPDPLVRGMDPGPDPALYPDLDPSIII